jgi:NitT/TauT family transport system substrate-binding protein
MITTSFINHFAGAGFVLTLLILLCLGATSGQAGDATSVVKIHLPGYSTSSLPFLIADELGFYREQGIRIELTRIQTGSGIQALVAGALDASQIVGPTTLAAILGGAPLKVVTVFNDKPTFKLYVKKQFRRFADLKGTRLGSTTPGSTNDRLLKVVLEKNGLDWRKDLSLIYIGLSEVMLKSLQSGAIDGTALTPPASFLAEDFGFTRYLVSSTRSAHCRVVLRPIAHSSTAGGKSRIVSSAPL